MGTVVTSYPPPCRLEKSAAKKRIKVLGFFITLNPDENQQKKNNKQKSLHHAPFSSSSSSSSLSISVSLSHLSLILKFDHPDGSVPASAVQLCAPVFDSPDPDTARRRRRRRRRRRPQHTPRVLFTVHPRRRRDGHFPRRKGVCFIDQKKAKTFLVLKTVREALKLVCRARERDK